MSLTTPGRQLSTSGLGPSLKWLPWFPGEPVEESEELSGLEGMLALTWVSLAVINYRHTSIYWSKCPVMTDNIVTDGSLKLE